MNLAVKRASHVAMTEKIRLHPDYTLRLVDLMRPVEIAKDFTLGDFCRILESCEEIDVETLSALVHCPLGPFSKSACG